MRHRIGIGSFPVFVLFAFWATDGPAQSVRYSPRTVLASPIRPITNPPIVEASSAPVAPNDLVIGVEIDGEARAYPINQLTGPSREIINDNLGGIAIAATW